MEQERTEHQEEIHLPAPSAAPILVAAGMTLTLAGLVTPLALIVGLMLLAAGIGIWAFGRR